MLNKPFLDLTCPKIVGLGFDPITNDYKVVVCYKLDSSADLGMVYLHGTSTREKCDIQDSLLDPDIALCTFWIVHLPM